VIGQQSEHIAEEGAVAGTGAPGHQRRRWLVHLDIPRSYLSRGAGKFVS
jgi:hypothetical protein